MSEVEKEFILAMEDNDTEERKYFDGDEILKEGRKYEVIVTKNAFNQHYQYDIFEGINIENDRKKQLQSVYCHNLDLRYYILSEPRFRIYNCYFYGCKFNQTKSIDQKCDYTNINNRELVNCTFINCDFSDSQLEKFVFTNCILTEVKFNNVEFSGNIDFKTSQFKEISFINTQNFHPNNLTIEQQQNAWFSTREQQQSHTIQEQANTIQSTKKDQIDACQKGFKELKANFKQEETVWLVSLVLFFLGLFFLGLFFLGLFFLGLSVPAFLILCHKDTNLLLFIPTSFLLFTGFYFSIYQYSRAKNLRIENQNKIALIDGYFALLADTDAKEKYPYFLQNFSDVIFTKAIPPKNEKNLPLDEIIRLAEIFKAK